MKKNFAILTHNTKSESTKRFLEEGRKKGHTMFILDPNDIIITTDRQGNIKMYNGEEEHSQKVDGVIARVGGSKRGLEILHALTYNFLIETTSTPYGIRHAGNKNLSQYLLAENKKTQPKTSNINIGGLPFDMLVETVGGIPCVMKTSHGSKGSGVYLFNDEKQSRNTLYNFQQRDTKGLLQEFIETSKEGDAKKDIRVIVIDGKVIAAMERSSLKDDIRSNYSISKKAQKIALTQDEINTCIEISNIFKLPYSGIDLMREVPGSKTLVCEVNSCPGLAIEKVTGVNVAKAAIEYLERKTNTNKIQGKNKIQANSNFCMIHGTNEISKKSEPSLMDKLDKKYSIKLG